MTTQTHRIPTIRVKHPILTVALIVLLAGLVCLGLLSLYSAGVAHADVGSAAGSGSGSAITTPPPVTVPVTVIDPGADPVGWLESAYETVKSGAWVHAIALGLMGLVWLARQKWALGRIKFFASDRGGVALVFLASLVTGIATALAATGKMPDAQAVRVILQTAFEAIGGFVTLKRVLWPPDKQPDPAPAIPPATVVK
jgi:hypothetical protein